MVAGQEPSSGAVDGPLIASQQELEAFASQPGRGDGPSAALRGVLAETALTGVVRYDWRLLKPLCHSLIDSVLGEFSAEEQVEVGPPRPMPGGGSLESLGAGLHGLLDGFAEAPFTLQRLCEVLLEPRKQYRKLDKLAAAIEKLLLVTSTVPTAADPLPRPALSSLGPVNDNPPSPYMPASSSAAGAARGGQQAQLANGPEAGGPGSEATGDGSGPGTGRSSAVFRIFMHAEPGRGGEYGPAAGGGEGSDSGSGAGGGMSAEDADEAELAKRFVEDALRTEPEPTAEEPAALQPGAASGGSGGNPEAGPDSDQQLQSPAGGQALTSGAGGIAGPLPAAAQEAGGEGAQQEAEPAAAMEVDPPSSAEQGPAPGAGAASAAQGAEQMPDAGA